MDARFYLSPLIDGDGRQTGWMASITDITEPKRVRAELEAAHERFVAVLDGLDAAVCGRRRQRRDPVRQPGLQEHLRLRRGGAAGRHLRPADAARHPVVRRGPAPPDARAGAPRALRRRAANALSGRWYHIRERATRWVDGRVVRMAIATDITDRKRVDEENRAQQERLQRTSRLITMGEMASTLAHELNQPLAAIANYSMGCVNRLQSGDYRRRTSSPRCRRPAPRPSGPARSSGGCASS
jgi:C4-dicarboxylate-specific signal transduction histidine kinase